MTTPCETQLLLPGMLQFAAWDALPGVSALRTQRHLLDSQPGQVCASLPGFDAIGFCCCARSFALLHL